MTNLVFGGNFEFSPPTQLISSCPDGGLVDYDSGHL